jgi:hypothetical protein
MKHSLEMVLLLVLLSSLSNKTILHNEKTFQNNWFYYSYPYYSGSSFLYFVVLHYRRTTRRKAETLTIQAVNQTAWDSTAAVSALEEITIISGTKTQLSSSRVGRQESTYNTQTVGYMKMTFTDSEKQML